MVFFETLVLVHGRSAAKETKLLMKEASRVIVERDGALFRILDLGWRHTARPLHKKGVGHIFYGRWYSLIWGGSPKLKREVEDTFVHNTGVVRKGDDSSEDDPLPNKKHKKEKKDKDNCSNLRLVHDLFHRLLCLVFVLCCLQDGAESKLKKDSKEKKDKDKKDKKEKKEKHKHGDDDEDFSSEKHKKLESEELRPAQAPPAPAEPKRVVGPQAFPPEAEPKDKKQKKDKKDKKSKAGPVATREVQLCSANAFKDRSRPFGMELDGALVVDLADGGAAIPAGVQIGWRVLEVDGKPVPEDDIGKAAEDLLGLLVVFAVCTTLPVFCSAQAVRKAEEKMANKSGKDAELLQNRIAQLSAQLTVRIERPEDMYVPRSTYYPLMKPLTPPLTHHVPMPDIGSK
eukprot:s326_g32.t1